MLEVIKVLGFFAWWGFALLNFMLFLGALVSLLSLDSKDGWPNLIFCSVAAFIVSGFLRLTEEMPIAGALVLVLLIAHFIIRFITSGLDKEDKK